MDVDVCSTQLVRVWGSHFGPQFSLIRPQKLNTALFWASNSICKCVLERNKQTHLQKNRQSNVHSSSIHISPTLQATHLPIKGWTDKLVAVCAHRRVHLGLRREGSARSWYSATPRTSCQVKEDSHKRPAIILFTWDDGVWQIYRVESIFVVCGGRYHATHDSWWVPFYT